MLSDGLSSHCKLEILRCFTILHFTIDGSLHYMILYILLYKDILEVNPDTAQCENTKYQKTIFCTISSQKLVQTELYIVYIVS